MNFKRTLITTPLEETWPAEGPILFAGEWCKRYSRREIWEKRDALVIPYHWDTPGKLSSDYLCLKILFEELLTELGTTLNRIHQTRHDLRYWRILIGPWLGGFVHQCFDRWETLNQAIKNDELGHAVILKRTEGDSTPKNTRHFDQLAITDAWNDKIFGQAIQFLQIPHQEVSPQTHEVIPLDKKISLKARIKNHLVQIRSLLEARHKREKDAFFYASSLPLPIEREVQVSLKQHPVSWVFIPAPRVSYESSKRKWTLETKAQGFSHFIRTMIPEHLPTVYLEGYQELTSKAKQSRWPKSPQYIFTATAFNSDDVFKAWAAEKTEMGSKLLIAQHGGHYGIGRNSFTEDHEYEISDLFLSFGWNDLQRPKVRPLAQIKGKRPLGVEHSKQPYLLLVLGVMPRYTQQVLSGSISSLWLKYFEDQCRFIESLSPKIFQNLKVRLYPHDYGWEQKKRLTDAFPQIDCKNTHIPMNKLVAQTRIYVSTYNATTFLEAFSMNVPTVIYWDPRHWELRETAEPYFQKLKDAKVFFESPTEAAQFVTQTWDHVDSWWNSEPVRYAVTEFCEKYSASPVNLAEKIVMTLKTLETI